MCSFLSRFSVSSSTSFRRTKAFFRRPPAVADTGDRPMVDSSMGRRRTAIASRLHNLSPASTESRVRPTGPAPPFRASSKTESAAAAGLVRRLLEARTRSIPIAK